MAMKARAASVLGCRYGFRSFGWLPVNAEDERAVDPLNHEVARVDAELFKFSAPFSWARKVWGDRGTPSPAEAAEKKNWAFCRR